MEGTDSLAFQAGGAARFIGIYPFLRENNDRSAMEFVVYPSQILPSPSGLFLGSQITTTNRKVLQDLGITYGPLYFLALTDGDLI